jgi:NADPH:quinone reductase-like Zn-dependent oxidoreductase
VVGGTQAEWDLAYTAIEEGLAVGALKPIVGLSFTLAEAKDAQIEVIEHTQGTAGKIVLLPWADQKP